MDKNMQELSSLWVPEHSGYLVGTEERKETMQIPTVAHTTDGKNTIPLIVYVLEAELQRMVNMQCTVHSL